MRVQRGFAIPLSLCVAGVVLFLGGSIAQLSAGDLQLSNHEYYQERARQVADFGLESGIAHQIAATTVYTYQGVSGCNSGDSAKVQIYDNTLGDLSPSSGCPVSVPKGFQYWVSTGLAKNDARVFATVKVGALVRWGMPLGSAGAQIHYLNSDSSNGKVTYMAVGEDNLELPDKILCATEARNGALPVPNPTALVKPVTFHEVESFKGTMRIPQGADLAEVVQATLKNPGDTMPFDATGGFFNIPDYSPPTPKHVYSGFEAPMGLTELPPGEYDTVKLPANADLMLKGVYHFKHLILTPTAPGAVGHLAVGEEGPAQVFIDEVVNPGQLRLGLRNFQTHAAAFRLNLKPTALGDHALELQVSAHSGGQGGVVVVAPKQDLKVIASSERLIRGSFCCETLSLAFDHIYGNSDSQPTFIYDTSADTTRGDSGGNSGDYRSDGISQPAELGVVGNQSQPMIVSKNEL